MNALLALRPRTAAAWLVLVRDYVQIIIGSVLVAVSIDLFLVPNDVVSGGVAGIAIILNDLVNAPIGLTILLLNLPLLVAGWRYLGGLVFGIRTVAAIIALSVATDTLGPLLGRWITAPSDPLLYTLYGGLLDGLGIGLVFRARGTTGGTDIMAQFMERRRGIPLGTSLLLLNGVVFAAAAYLFSFDKVLYALIVSFVSARAVDVVLKGFGQAQQAIIVSSAPDAIRQRILHDLGRGVTLLEGRGGYTDGTRTVLLTVVARSEISVLKQLLHDADPHAFVIFGTAEVAGEGFQSLKQ